MPVSICMVPLGPSARISAGAFRRDLENRWLDLPTITPGGSEDGVLQVDIGDARCFIAYMPAPIPWSDLEGPCATSVLWPDAAAELRDHKSHLVVTVLAEWEPLEMSELLTKVTASILATCDAAIGVYWGNATLVIPKKMFIDFAIDVMPEETPLYIWVDFRVGKGKNGRSAGFTAGMQALGHMEFETRNATDSPGDLRDRLMALAGYVVENGPVINDGDTVGGDEYERIKVIYADSTFGHEEQVMRLDYSRS